MTISIKEVLLALSSLTILNMRWQKGMLDKGFFAPVALTTLAQMAKVPYIYIRGRGKFIS